MPVHLDLKLIPKTNNLALSIEINAKILERNENVILSAGEDDFYLFEVMVNSLQQSTKNIILLGDFNAKTKDMSDFIMVNQNYALYQLDGILDQNFI